MTKTALISIPKSALQAQLDEAANLKRELTGLLAELEQGATNNPPATIGGWRHDPMGWAGRHLRSGR